MSATIEPPYQHCLIVDDEEDMRGILEMQLGILGVSGIETYDSVGQTVQEVAEKIALLLKQGSLLTLDGSFGGNTNILDLIQLLRNQLNGLKIRVICISGSEGIGEKLSEEAPSVKFIRKGSNNIQKLREVLSTVGPFTN